MSCGTAYAVEHWVAPDLHHLFTALDVMFLLHRPSAFGDRLGSRHSIWLSTFQLALYLMRALLISEGYTCLKSSCTKAALYLVLIDVIRFMQS